MSFAPETEAFAVTVAETAVVGDGISVENGSALKYNGVNSMVGTLISWNGKNGGYISHPVSRMSSVWVIDNKGEMVNGANTDRCPPINFYSKANDNLSAIKLIAGKNATPTQGTKVEEKLKLYKGETFDNITNGTFNGKAGVNYFTVGGAGASDSKISEDWAKAIFAASLYSNSGILNNKDFGGEKAKGEYPEGWIPEYQAITEKVSDTDSNAKYVTKFGTPFNSQLLEKNKTGDYNYIAIKLESDWVATDVSGITDTEKDAGNEPVGVKGHIGRLSNGVNDNNPDGDTLIPLGTTFDANYDKHIMSEIDTGNVYLKSVYTGGKVDTEKSAEPRLLSERIKNYATSYNEEIRTQQLTFCPAGEGYSFGRLAIPDNAYVILDLNGHTIDRALNDNDANVDTIVQSVFMLGQYARLEVFDSSVSDEHPFGRGEVKGGYTKNGTGKVFDNQKWDNYGSDSNYANAVKGGGFTLRNRAELTVHSGNVTNNQGLFGGAFYGVGASTVNVFDANIEGNSAVRGGMCYLSQGSFMTLNMFGGLVQGNSARMDGFEETNSHGQPRQPSSVDPEALTEKDIYDTQILKNPDGYAHEGGGICVYQESYCNIYGGTITHNYSAMFGGGISVSYNSFLKLFGGEITGNVAKGIVRNIEGAKVVSVKDPKQTETPEANVGGAGINMYQDSAGIYLNGPAKVMGNYCSQAAPASYSAKDIAALIESDGDKEDSNLYLSLTTSMSRYSWNSDSKTYEESKTRYNLTGDWDETYGPAFKTGGVTAGENQAVSRKGQMKFNPKQHLYPEIKVQGPLYRDATHVAQVSITPAAGIEAGGYIMRQFYPQGWEDGTEGDKQTSDFNGTNGPRPLKSGAEGTIDESSHAKNQINANGGTTFNLREFLKTGATSGYVDGFLFTDGGTSIVAGTGDDDGWYLALGTRQEGNLPVKWQYYDSTVDPKTNKPYGWLDATTSAESGTGFTLVYNGTDRKYDIRVFVDRTKLTSDESGVTSGYFYLYYDYYTVADETGKETEPEADGTAKKHYLYASDADKNSGKYTNILYITSGYDDSDMEIVQDKGVIYASERYDILGYRFTIRADAKDLKGAGDGTATPFNEKDDFVANPNYATMKIERATLMVSQIKLADITRYYDGTRDFYIPSTTITAGTLTGQAPNDQSKLLMKFSGESDGYVHGTLSSPNVGTNNVSLGVIIEELGGEDHKGHNKNTFPDKCLLANYMLYDLNTETTYPAEDREEMSVTLNVNVQPKPITVELEKQSYEYGSIPVFDSYWGTHADSANWAQTYEKAKDGATLKALFEPGKAPVPGEPDFNPNKLGMDGKLAKVDIDNENVDPDHGTVDKGNLALRLDQILKISFSSTYTDRSPVGIYGGSFSYTNGNYNVTWQLGKNKVAGMGKSGNLTPAQVDELIEITKRKITAVIPNAASIYGEAQETLTLPEANIKHLGDDGQGLVFGDSLSATLDLADAEKVKTSSMLRATVDADGNKIDKNKYGYYEICITNLDKINSNYELTEKNVTRGKYVVYPRKIVLKAGDYSSVYGDPVNTDKMGGFTSSLAAEQKEGLHTSSTVILPVDEAAFNKGVTYSYTAGSTPKNKGGYKFNVSFNHALAVDGAEDIGINYDVSYGDDATHTVEARQVVVLIASPATQASEYGEEPVVQQGNGTGTYWLPQYTVNASTKDVVVLTEDWENFRAGIKLYLADAVNETAPAGKYPLMGKYSGSENYTVDFRGMWEGDIAEKYKDAAFGNIVERAGIYTVNRRNIQLHMSTTLASEYGDDLVKFWDSGAYTFSRTDGKNAIVNGDKLTFDPSLFYIQVSSVSSSRQIHGGDENVAFSSAQLPADTYSVIFDGTAYKASDAYNEGANANYEISENRGRYTVSKRALTVKIGATVDGEFNQNPTIEYGNDVPERTAQITRTSGKEGVGFIGTDGDFITDYLATTASISNYTSSLSQSQHLRIGVYEFTVPRNNVSNNYDVTWQFGSLTVTQRVVHVTVREQTSVYTGVEPHVSNDAWDLVDRYTLASGDERSIVRLDKEDGFNAGKYNITLSCTDGNYKFVVDDGDSDENNLIATQKYVITPAKITFSLSGDSMIYDAQSHLLDFYFSGDGVTPANHTLQGQMPATGEDGSVTFTFTDGLYTVTIRYKGDFGGKVSDAEEYKNVGSYTVTIKLKNKNSFGEEGYEGNFCFEETAGISRIAAEEYVYVSSKTYEITKATIYIPDLASKAYTRDEQEADWNFANDLNTTVVPDKSNYNYIDGGGYVKYAIKMDGGEYADTNSRLGDKNHLPYYRGTYTFTLTLTDDDYKNFMFEDDQKSTEKEFKITPLEILSSLAQSSAEYDDESRFHGDMEGGRYGAWSFNFSSTTATSVDGISYNLLFEYKGWGATDNVAGEHTLIVKVGGYEHAGIAEREKTQYFVDGESIDEARMKEILANIRAFIDAGTYTYTLTFEYKNFLLRSHSGSETVEKLEYEYTITPVLISVEAFNHKEFNNAEQDAEITEATFLPSSTMTAKRAFELLQKDYNGYTLSYSVPTFDTSENNGELRNGKPFNAGTYTVIITLKDKGNFAFSALSADTYEYVNSGQRFVIDPFDISRLFHTGDHGAAHAFEGELDGKLTSIPESGASIYAYTYTGMEIMPKLIKATIYLTAESVGIVYGNADEIDKWFTIGNFTDNINTDAMSGHHASLVVTGKGNYTGNTTMSFSIVPMELTAKIGEANSAYGESLNLTNDLITYESGMPYETDDLKYTFALVGRVERNGHVVAGTYAIKAECGNLNYNITFKGDWKSEDENNGVCGVYTVDKRQIIIKIENQSATYSGTKPTVGSAMTQNWSATSSRNGTGKAIVTGDEDLKITLYLDGTHEKWDVGSYTIKGTLVEDDIGKNYEVTWEDGAFEITAVKISVTLKPQTSEYDGSVPEAQQGADWYQVTSGEAVEGEDLNKFIRIYIVTPAKHARQYQLTGESTSANYEIKFTDSNYTVTQRALVITIKDAESYYGEAEVVLNEAYYTVTHNRTEAGAIVAGDDLAISLTKALGTEARAYNITGTWNNDSNYTVTWKGTNGTMGVYTIKKRPITVHIKDQHGVYGSINTNTLSQNEGEDGDWYIDNTLADGLTGTPLVGSDVLGVTLSRTPGVAPMAYKITGTASNLNYEVTWEGGWEGDDDAGHAGTYTVEKRKVTITVLTQYGTYGEDKRISQLQGTAYSIACTNAGDGIAFVAADSVKLDFAIDEGITAVNEYPIYLTITFGVSEHQAWYEITVETDGVLQPDGRYKVENAYKVERRKLEVTIVDLNSVYGDEIRPLQLGAIICSNASGTAILPGDDEALRALILTKLHIVVEGAPYDYKSKKVIEVGTYRIAGEHFEEGNYEITFKGSAGESGDEGVYTVEKRVITVSIQNDSCTYGDIGEYAEGTAEKERVDRSLQMTLSSNGTAPNIAAVNGDELGIKLFLNSPALSTSKHLKQGMYYIWATYSNDEHIAKNYTISPVWGEFTVRAREITVRLATNKPTSEYGDPITDQSGWGYEASLTNGGEGDAILEGDLVEFTMATALTGDTVENGRVTATLVERDGNDNSNYRIEWTLGNYSIVQRRIVIVVDEIKPVVYGTPWKMPTYTAKRADGEGKAILDEGEVEIVINVQNPQTSATGFLRWKEGGYSLTADVTGTKQGNYSVTIENIGTVKYVVEKLKITIAIEDATSVYGEAFADFQWTDTEHKIVEKDGAKDDLQIVLRRVGEQGNVGLYPISGECRNTDYNVTFEGSWEKAGAYQGKCGTYEVTQREVHLTVSNQSHAIYGETITIREPVIGSTVKYADGNLYALAAGDRIASVVELYILTAKPDTEWDNASRLDAGNYTLCVRGINDNYKIVMDAEGNFLVNRREIHVHIEDQHGVYGEENEVAANCTPKNGNGTGDAIVTGDEFLFTFTSDASKAKANVGSYPIKGSAEAQGDTKASNYTIIFEGSFEGGQDGTYTITERIIVVTITDQTAIYGGEDGATLIPTPDNTFYTAAYNGDTSNAILAGDEKDLKIRFTLKYSAADLSTAGALKAGTYAIVGAYGTGNSHTNYEVSFVGGWTGEGENHNTAGTFTVTPRGITVSLGLDSTVSSSYGDVPAGPWSQAETSMYIYTLTSGTGPAIIRGDKDDVIEFTMETLATAESHVGNYPLIGKLKEGKNDNGNYNITFTGAFVDTVGGANERYNGIAGIYTVTPRKITAQILPYFREYGERVDNETVLSALNEEETDGVYFKLQAGWSVNGDKATALHITLSCNAGVDSPAQTYTITGTTKNGDYEVTFSDGEGKYTIMPRTVYVVILPQVSVYGAPIDENQHAWYAFRKGYKAIWSGASTSDQNGVLAAGETLDALNVRLTKRNAIDGYDFSEGNGTYGGQYAIEGSYNNPNYNVIFVGAYTDDLFPDLAAFKKTDNTGYLYEFFTSRDTYDYEKDEAGIRKKQNGENGVYTVAPRKISITLKSVNGTYGGSEYTRDGSALKKGVELDPAENSVWAYTPGQDGRIDAGHIGYLSFYVGGKYSAVGPECLTPRDYPIVAYWGLGTEEKSRVRDWNYEISFYGDWDGSLDATWSDDEGNTAEAGHAGVFTVKNATIKQHGNWYEALEYILDHDAEPYTMSVNNSTDKDKIDGTRTGKQYFEFQGDITEGKVTYGKLYFNENRNTKEGVMPTTEYDQKDPATGAPKVNKAGYWILEVTVEAQYHETATFDLVYHITPDLIVLTLKGDASYEFTYGDYFYDETDRTSGTDPFSALEAALKAWLFDAAKGNVIDVLVNGAEHKEDIQSYLKSLLEEHDVVVSIYKMASNRSTGGYLNAGSYLITISGGSNIEIAFAEDYDIVVCKQKTVSAEWAAEGTFSQDTYEGAGLFTYTYDGKQHPLTPRVSGLLGGDHTVEYAAAHYRYEEGSGDGAPATPLGYGYYVCRVTSVALGGLDGANYAVEEGLHAFVYIQKRAITVKIEEQANHTYGDPEQGFGIDDWNVDGVVHMADGEIKSMLGVVLEREEGKNVGSYKIRGTATNVNYDVTFTGNWKKDGDPENGKCGTFIIDPRPITVTLFDKTVTYGTALPAEDDLASDITLWYATYDRNPRGVAIIQGDDIHLTMKIGYTSADLTATGYLMAKSYTVKAGWNNGNYTVTFESDSTPSLATSLYIVGKRSLRVSLFDAAPTEYGYDRPGSISHAFTGFTSRDQAYFAEHPEKLFIRFFFFDPGKNMQLSPDAKYDPVGTYAVCGEVTDKNDPIGSNYEVNFVGSWDNNAYPGLVQHAGVYLVTPRTISIIIYSVSSEYGEIAYVPIALQPGSSLVGSDTLEELGIRYKTAAYHDGRTNKPGVYSIEYDSIANPNYRVSGAMSINATYTVLKRKIKLIADDQSGEYGDEHTVQSVQDVHWRAVWVTAGGELREGPGIAYEDDLINNLRLFCREATASARVGSYSLSATYETDDRYEIIAEEYGDYQVLPREIIVHVESYTDREYGEDHAAFFRNAINIQGRGFYFERKNGGGDAIAFYTDPIWNFRLALDVTAASHVGDYAITCVYSDSNYSVAIMGTYMDEDGNVIGGTYTINPRKITVVIRDQTGEYGDDHTLVDRYGVTWTASRPAGGIAIIGTDDLKLTFTTNATAQSGVNGAYSITAVCGNKDYAVTFIDGTYTVTPRKLTASVYGESEYGDPLQEMELVLSRTTAGLGGPGIMPWDASFLTITASCAVHENSPVGHYPVTYTINVEHGTNANYEIVNSNEGEYVVLPREIVVNIGSVRQTYGDPVIEGSGLTYTVSRANGKEGEAILNGEIAIVLRVLAFSRNAGTYTIGMEDIDNDNYKIVEVKTGKYTIEQKQITVHIDDKSSEYGSAVESLTVGEVEGLVEGDDLGLSLRVEWGDDLAWHNVGNYAIVGRYDNLNYLVTFDGSWAARDAVGGTYTVYKAKNLWLKEYSGDGTVVQGNGLGEGEAPTAKFGEAVIRYYYDEACTQEIEGDITELEAGVYYAKATVADTLNYSDVATVFAIEVLSAFIYPSGALDVTLFVSIFASQFVIGICALLFVRRRKNKKNQSQSEGTK